MIESEPESGAAAPARRIATRLEDTLPAGVVLLLAVVLLVLQQIAAAILWVAERPILGLILPSLLGIVFPILVVHRLLGIPWRAGLGLRWLGWSEVGRLVWMLAAATPLTYALGAWARSTFPPDEAQFELYRALVPTGWASILAGALATVVVVPLGEEILFRRLVLGALRRWLPPLAAAVTSGVLFGIVHASAWLLLPISFLGTLLGWLVVRTGSLGIAWLGHGLFNLVAYVELCISRDPKGERLELWSTHPGVWIPCLALLGAWCWAEWRGSRATLRSRAEPAVELRPVAATDDVDRPEG